MHPFVRHSEFLLADVQDQIDVHGSESVSLAHSVRSVCAGVDFLRRRVMRLAGRTCSQSHFAANEAEEPRSAGGQPEGGLVRS